MRVRVGVRVGGWVGGGGGGEVVTLGSFCWAVLVLVVEVYGTSLLCGFTGEILVSWLSISE